MVCLYHIWGDVWSASPLPSAVPHLPFCCASPLPSGVPHLPLSAGKYVELKDTINDFKGVLEGKYDDLPEMAFYMVSFVRRNGAPNWWLQSRDASARVDGNLTYRPAAHPDAVASSSRAHPCPPCPPFLPPSRTATSTRSWPRPTRWRRRLPASERRPPRRPPRQRRCRRAAAAARPRPVAARLRRRRAGSSRLTPLQCL